MTRCAVTIVTSTRPTCFFFFFFFFSKCGPIFYPFLGTLLSPVPCIIIVLFKTTKIVGSKIKEIPQGLVALLSVEQIFCILVNQRLVPSLKGPGDVKYPCLTLTTWHPLLRRACVSMLMSNPNFEITVPNYGSLKVPSRQIRFITLQVPKGYIDFVKLVFEWLFVPEVRFLVAEWL